MAMSALAISGIAAISSDDIGTKIVSVYAAVEGMSAEAGVRISAAKPVVVGPPPSAGKGTISEH
jgi:hypothetical protein